MPDLQMAAAPVRPGAEAQGFVLSVRGAVVDVHFDLAMLSAVDTALIVAWDRAETLVL
jgi:hypothetical protein